MVAVLDFHWNNFSHFWSTSHPNASYQVSSQMAFPFRRRSEIQIFKMVAMVAILDFRPEQFYIFLSTSHPEASYQFSSQLTSVQEKKRKIDFQDEGHNSHFGFPIRTILACLIY